MRSLALAAVLVSLLSGCGIEEAIRKNDDRYAKPGAMDPVLADLFYRRYSFNVLDRYAVLHDWVNTSGCSYRATMKPGATPGELTFFYVGRDIVEKDGKTWLKFSDRLFDFDPWVRSVKWVSQEKGKEGQTKEVGLKPVCFEYWWASSHYLAATIRRSSLSDYEASFANSYRLAKWSTRQLNGLTWRVAEVPTNLLQVRPPNGLGGPYQAWLTTLGDTGYVVSIEMGASKESLDHPKAHAEIEAVFMHLVNSLKVQRLNP